MRRPLVIELFCGTFGWSAGWLAMGGQAVGFDIEHEAWHGGVPANAELVLQDVLTLHGSQFRNADLILASPPCQRYSYMAMPWTRAKAQAKWYRDEAHPERLTELNALFNACFRLQREASEAAGRHIPMVLENVKGAQPWVGSARWHFGSYYLWGDVPALMPPTERAQKFNPDGTAHPPGSWFAIADSKNRGAKNTGGSWFNIGSLGQKVTNRNPVHEATKIGGDWFSDPASPSRRTGSKSKARRAASAHIARIPQRLSEWIAECYWPREALRTA